MPLSAYHEKINNAAGDLCVRNPSLLSDKGERLLQARILVDQSGYQYKKGKSRSKVFGEAEIPAKRPKLDKNLRVERITQIQEEVGTINQQITFKEKRIESAVEIKNFKLCDNLSEEIHELQKRRQELNNELKLMQKKDKKARWYQTKKQIQSSSDSESSSPSKRRSISITPSSSRPHSPESIVIPSDSDEGGEKKSSIPKLSPVPTKLARSGSGISSPPSTVQAGSTATTTTAHQPLIEGDSSPFFSYPSTAQSSRSITASQSLAEDDASRSLNEGDSPVDPFSVQADNTTTTISSHQSILEGDAQSDGNPNAAERSGNLPSSSTDPIF